MKKIKVYKLVPGRHGYEKEIYNTLDTFQEEVGGYIETCSLGNGLIAIVDEEGVIKDLPATAILPYYGVIRGNIVFARDNGEDFTSLTDEDIEMLEKWYKE